MQHEPNDVVRLTILRLVDTLFLQTTGCSSADSEAGRLIWKGLFCDVVVQLVVRGLVDEELEDVLRICADPSRDPRAMLLGEDATEPPLPPEPRLPPVPRPRPPTPEPEPRPRPSRFFGLVAPGLGRRVCSVVPMMTSFTPPARQ